MKDNKDRVHSRHSAGSRLVAAFFFILAGLLLIAHRTESIPDSVFYLFFNWQMLLIAIGLTQIAKKGSGSGGYILILVGAIFLLPDLFDLSFNTRQLLFPAILIGIGLFILFRSTSKWQNSLEKRFKSGDISDMDMIDANHIFGGGDYHITSDNFKGGRINCVFGGGKYDFRKANLADGVVVLEVSMVFGGLEIIVPNDWNVKVEVDSILGGFSQKNLDYLAPKNDIKGQLIIRGSAIFGGGELKRM